jgi:hypothetical protein
MDTAIFRVSECLVNSFIYCCLILNTIKRTCSEKSLTLPGLPSVAWNMEFLELSLITSGWILLETATATGHFFLRLKVFQNFIINVKCSERKKA